MKIVDKNKVAEYREIVEKIKRLVVIQVALSMTKPKIELDLISPMLLFRNMETQIGTTSKVLL